VVPKHTSINIEASVSTDRLTPSENHAPVLTRPWLLWMDWANYARMTSVR